MSDTKSADKASPFRSLRHRNVRVYFFGLLLSNVGTWLQFTATSLLIYRINNRATDAGLNTMFQFLPMLVLGAWAGGFADRHDRRTITMWTQGALLVQAVLLAAADFAGFVSLPVVYALSLVLGIANAIDNPSRRGLVTELVEPREISNAMALNTTVMTGSRIFGPALAALLIGPLGTAWLFSMNAVSYVAVIVSVLMLRTSDMIPVVPAPRTPQPVREALRFVWADAHLRYTFIVFVVVSTFAFNYSVVLPKLSDVTICGLSCIGMAFSPNFYVACAMAIPLGLGGTGLVAAMTGITQQKVSSEMRSRMMALQSVAFLGSTPIGGPITGWIGDHISLRWSLGYGGVLALLFLPFLKKAK
jgi:MFS family permease